MSHYTLIPDNTTASHLSRANSSQVIHALGQHVPLEAGDQGQSLSPLHNSNPDMYTNNGSAPQWVNQAMTGQPHNLISSSKSAGIYHPPYNTSNTDNVYHTHRVLTTSRDEEAAHIHTLENQIKSVEGQLDYLKQELEKCRQNHFDKTLAVQTFESVTGLGSRNNVATGNYYQSGFSASGSNY